MFNVSGKNTFSNFKFVICCIYTHIRVCPGESVLLFNKQN